MSLETSSEPVVVYGLSTEGYKIASAIAVRGHKVSLIDESARMAIVLKPEIIKTYPTVSSLLDDEPLLELQPVDVAIKMATYVFFSPKVRKTGQDVRADISSKLRDVVRSISPGSSIVFTLPTGVGGNTENIALIEHLTGFVIGRDIYYYYLPITSLSELNQPDLLVGSSSTKEKDLQLLGLIQDLPRTEDSNIVDISSAELAHVIRILEHYTGLASTLEVCKQTRSSGFPSQGLQNKYGELYIDEISNGLYDLRLVASSLSGAGPLAYLVNGTIKGIEGYVKHLIDRLRLVLKMAELKASRTRVIIAWTLDQNEMKGDKIELFSTMESRLKDYIGDVERRPGTSLDIYPTDKDTVVIACSKNDFSAISMTIKQNLDMIIMKANPVCEAMVCE
ncbi:MAG TPA: hypothetical protein VE504_07565 [Nitrososphaeraceae archaeon]|jgi:hypothetical protein|nr:hypothetical protein [Nitrososphaeraceae archaeon]